MQELTTIKLTGHTTGSPRGEYAVERLYDLGLVVADANEQTGEIDWALTRDGESTLRGQ